MTSKFYPEQKSSKMMRFFWKAAGADRYILERSTYGDQIKYLCLGGIILSTGVMAGIAGGYAFYTIFEPRGNALDSFKTVNSIAGNYDSLDILTSIKALIFGVIWGLIIFNIDRFIITSTGKGDGTEDITKKELKGALPRLIMGAIIALTISKPVEIRMFKTEIDIALHQKQLDLQKQYQTTVDSNYKVLFDLKDKEILMIQQQLSSLRESYKNLLTNYTEEVRIITVGPRARALKSQMDAVENKIKELESNPDFIRIKKEKQVLEKKKEAEYNDSQKVAAGLDGLLERIKLAHEIAGWVVSLFITLLFMAIELTPIFFKLMLIKSPYDYIEENVKELIKVENGIEIKHDYYTDKEGKERELVIHHEVIKALKEKIQLLESQSEISSTAITSWKNKKMDDANNNPESFINEG